MHYVGFLLERMANSFLSADRFLKKGGDLIVLSYTDKTQLFNVAYVQTTGASQLADKYSVSQFLVGRPRIELGLEVYKTSLLTIEVSPIETEPSNLDVRRLQATRELALVAIDSKDIVASPKSERVVAASVR